MSDNAGSIPSPSLKGHLRDLTLILLTIGLGAIGGYLFLLARMPLPWMMGAMFASTAAALAGAPLRSPGRFRKYMIAVIGIMVGSSFTADILERATNWLVSLSALAIYTIVAIFALGWALYRLASFHPADAFCSAAPGGFAEMVVLGGSMGGDEREILAHAQRPGPSDGGR